MIINFKKLVLIFPLFAILFILTTPNDSYATTFIDSSSAWYMPNSDFFLARSIPTNYSYRPVDTTNWSDSDAHSSSGFNSVYLNDLQCIAYDKSGQVYFGASSYANHPCVEPDFAHILYKQDTFLPSFENGLSSLGNPYSREFTFNLTAFSERFISRASMANNVTVTYDFVALYDWFDTNNNGGFSFNAYSVFTDDGSNNTHSSVGSCSTNYYYDQVDDFYHLKVTCSAPRPLLQDDFVFSFHYGVNTNNLPFVSRANPITSTYNVSFSSVTFVFDDFYNETYTDGIYRDIQSELGDWVNDYMPADNGGFFGRLINIFSFNTINPLSGFFELFSDAQSCRSIPILANMLGVNDPDNFVYCSWFPAHVRNVLTPVIGMMSTILLFGFFVSWLKGSGPVFTDHTYNIKGGK